MPTDTSFPADHRRVAADVLARVRTGGAWANVLIDTLDASPDVRVAVRADVLGALRWSGEITAALEAALERPLGRLQPEVAHLLMVGTHELFHTDTPAPIVVSASVDTTRAAGAPKAAGLVNAVLRRVAAAGRPELPVAVAAGYPPWLHERLAAAWGRDAADAFVVASNRPPRVGIRLRPGETDLGETVPGIPEARLVDRPPSGAAVQDPASVAVVQALDPHPGDRCVELAAAPGGKTAHLLDRTGGPVIACELHPRRVRTGARRVPEALWVRADATAPPLRAASFDRVLLDAPCSGLGTLRRRPEIRHRITPEEVERLASTQRRMLERALEFVAPGGRLVYSVCTVLPEETEAVVAGLGFTPPDLPGERRGDGILLAPHLGPTDGMFVSVYTA